MMRTEDELREALKNINKMVKLYLYKVEETRKEIIRNYDEVKEGLSEDEHKAIIRCIEMATDTFNLGMMQGRAITLSWALAETDILY